MEIKALLYCTKAKPYLYKTPKTMVEHFFGNYHTQLNKAVLDNAENCLNGKIVAECDFEVEKIRKGWGSLIGTRYFRSSKNHYYPDYELEQQSCLCFDEIDEYLKGTLNEKSGYAINIKNLHIFDEPKKLSDFGKYDFEFANPFTQWQNNYIRIEKAPQNMMWCTDLKTNCDYILISIQSHWLRKILNGEKTIEVRKKVLKGMLK